TVLAAIRIHGPEVATIVEETLVPNGVPANLTIAAVIAAIGAHLGRTTDALVAADRAHTIELSDDDGFRRIRDERALDLKELLSTLRTNLLRNYPSGVAGAYGLPAVMPDDAPALLVLAGNVESLLRSRPLTETPKNQSLKLDPVIAANDVKSSAEALRDSLANIDREKREAQLTQNTKNEAMAAWAKVYGPTADGAAAFFALGGRLDLAQRVRPTARKRAGLPDEEPAQPQNPEPTGNPTESTP
ncbi:MAG TPA: hypothetical protein PK156_37435, partial [Polyangium sp.]|nr:hypothetical protein [Polyangium sp.]